MITFNDVHRGRKSEKLKTVTLSYKDIFLILMIQINMSLRISHHKFLRNMGNMGQKRAPLVLNQGDMGKKILRNNQNTCLLHKIGPFADLN